MLKAHKIRLNPTPEQEQYFLRAAGVARFVWNVCLEEYKRQRDAGERIDWNDLKKWVRSRIDAEWPWMREVTKCAAEQAIADLRRSINTYYKAKKSGQRRLRFPGWRKRSKRVGGFGLSNDHFHCSCHQAYIPKLGLVNMAEELRLTGKIMSGRVVENAGHWYLVVVVDVGEKQESGRTGSVGIDFGLKSFAVCSDGKVYETQAHYRRAEQRLKRLQRALARKKRGSKNRQKARLKVARQHERVANQRRDFTHKMTTEVSQQYRIVCVEDLSLSGMAQTRLAKSVHDAGIGMAVQQFGYKADELVKVGRFYPSSQLCHLCGLRNRNLTLKDREWTCCGCGAIHDRDGNASLNIEAEGLRLLGIDRDAGSGYVGVCACGVGSSGSGFNLSETFDCEAGTFDGEGYQAGCPVEGIEVVA